MNSIALHIANGNMFFLGIVLIITVSLPGIWIQHKWFTLISRNLLLFGILFVLTSSTPLPCWFYLLWGFPAFQLLWSMYAQKKEHPCSISFFRILMIIVSIAAAILEFPYHLKPAIDFEHESPLLILGDSFSAGIEHDGVTATWPVILKEEFGVNIIDLSYPGLTLEPALRRLQEWDGKHIENPTILLEIGGNDMLGGTKNARQFQEDLHELLDFVSQVSDTVFMFELPLPPFHHFYGKAQRDFAKHYNVTLIPKRYFTKVFGQPDAMFDELHLSQKGHRYMAEMLWELMGR